MEKIIKNIKEAQRIIKSLERIIGFAYQTIIKDKKSLIKIIIEIKKAILYLISASLHYEYVNKKIKISKDSDSNFDIFIKDSSKRFDVKKDEIKKIKEIFEISDYYKHSTTEFIKNNKIIMVYNSSKKEIDIEKIEGYLKTAKSLLEKVKNNMSSRVKKDI